MNVQRTFYCVVFLLLSNTAGGDTLFNSDETLKLTISAPFRQIEYQRDKQATYPATLIQENGLELDISLQVRGNNRLKKSNCDYPPLKVLLDKKLTEDTLFDKQSKIKLVVQCKDNKQYQEYIRLEYLIYKIYARLTDNHFKVRWLELTYRENDSQNNDRQFQKQRTEYAFFIEQKKRLKKRLELSSISENSVAYDKLNPEMATLVDLFEYMIGNTDYSNVKSPGEEDCCHNIKLMVNEKNESSGFIPIPYDFDNSGLINARYAVSPSFMHSKKVTTRLYRGLCTTNSKLPETIDVFLKEKENILDIIRNDQFLQDKTKKRAAKYLDVFFGTIESDKKQNRYLYGKCRG
jgi:hypothetical protein